MLTIKGAQVSARMALSLMQIGLLAYRDWAIPWQHESDLIERAMAKWLRKATSELQLFQFGITYSDHRASEIEQFNGWLPDDSDHRNQVSFTIYRIGDIPSYTLGTGITELEQAIPGLGETAMHYLEQTAVLPILTPSFALYLAQHTYWRGEEDETIAIEEELEYCEEGTTAEQLDIYCKSDFLTTIPEWAATAKQRLPLSSLRRIALEQADTDAGKVAAILLKIARFRSGYWLPDAHAEQLECSDVAAIFRWSTNDDCGRIVDDAFQQIFESGENTDDFGTAYLAPEAEPLKAWLRSAENTFRLLRLCEQLVWMVGQPERH
jgi:PRTRC genetic system protein F